MGSNLQYRIVVLGVALGLLGCGPGLRIQDPAGSPAASEVERNGLSLSTATTALRQNDCVAVTVQSIKPDASALTGEAWAVSLGGSAAIATYSSLLGCQTFDSAEEVTSVVLSPTTGNATFYIRPDSDANLTLTASATNANSDSLDFVVTQSPFETAEGASDGATDIEILASGKMYVAGPRSFDSTYTGGLLRLNADGTLDTTFQISGTGFAGRPAAVAVQSDERIIVVGNFTSYNGTARPRIARLNSDGTLDTTFAVSGTGFDDVLSDVAIQSDGQIVVTGSFYNYNGTLRPGVARLNTDGSLDSSFAQTGTGFDQWVNSVAIQSNGRIVVGGAFSSYNGTTRKFVARLNANGTLDNTFTQTGSGLNSSVLKVLVVPSSGSILVAGQFFNYNLVSRPCIGRLTSTGAYDATFSTTGTGLNDEVTAIALNPAGNIVYAAGKFTTYNGTTVKKIIAISNDATGGSLLGSFSSTAKTLEDEVTAVAVQSDGKILAGGHPTRLETDGSVDSSFYYPVQGFSSVYYSTSGYSTGARAAALQSDGKIILGGNFSRLDATPQYRLSRLLPTGALDTSFSVAGTGFNAEVHSISIQSDGAILVAGAFTQYNGTARNLVARVTSTGALDNTFSLTGTGFGNWARWVQAQPDGKIIVGGEFTDYNGTSRRRVARLNSDGSLDNTFSQTGSGLNDAVYKVERLSDGKYLVAGDFTSYNGTSRPKIARLNSDGSLDNTFAQTGTGLDDTVYTFEVQDDGSILVGGAFLNYNGVSQPYVAKLTSTGALDATFQNTASGPIAQTLLTQPDGKIIVGGSRSDWTSPNSVYLVRLNADGSTDSSFMNAIDNPNREVFVLSQQSDYKVIVGGGLTYYRGQTVSPLFRILPNGNLD